MANILYSVSRTTRSSSRGSLIDRGANGGLAGIDVKVIEKVGKCGDVSGIDNHTVNDLEVVNALALVQTNKGPHIVHLNQYAYLGKGKSIHCAGQIEYAGNEVNDKST